MRFTEIDGIVAFKSLNFNITGFCCYGYDGFVWGVLFLWLQLVLSAGNLFRMNVNFFD